MAQISKRGTKWRARIRRRGYPELSKTFPTKSAAERWVRAIERSQDEGSLLPAALASRTTFGELVERYRAEVTPTKKASQHEEWRLDLFARSSLAPVYVQNVTPSEIAAWRDARLEHDQVAASTVNRDLNLLSHVFTVAAQEWGMALPWGNPVAGVRRPKLSSTDKRERRLEAGEEEAFLAAADEALQASREAEARGSPAPVPIKEIFQLVLETGLRRSEVSNLLWSDVDLSSRVLTVREGKTGRRRVPLSSRAVDILRGLNAEGAERIWPFNAQSISRAFVSVCKRAGIEGLRFHDLRHEATSRLFEKGLDLMEVAAITGHRSLGMLKRYTHLRAEDLAKKL